MNNDEIFNKIAAECQPDVALRLAGLQLKQRKDGASVTSPVDGRTYISPLRDEQSPSCTFYKKNGHWRFSDKGAGKYGNMINLVAYGQGLSHGEAAQLIDETLNLKIWSIPRSPQSSQRTTRRYQSIDLRELDDTAAQQLARTVGIKGTEGIRRLESDGLLKYGDCWFKGRNNFFAQPNCWFLLDKGTSAATARRADGAHIGTNKSMTPAKWHKRPIGISGLKQQEHRRVIICEGEKDSIAVMHAYASDNSSALVCMPSTTTNLTGTTIPSFIQEVIILAQHDKQGIEAALKWHAWASATVTKVEIRLPQLDGLDWADLLMLLTAPHAQDTLLRGIAQSIFTTQEDLNELNELLQTAPETPPAKRPAKQRGSKPNLERDENIRAVMRGLPTQDKKSPTKICLALGWNLNSANRTKIRRSLSRIDQT